MANPWGHVLGQAETTRRGWRQILFDHHARPPRGEATEKRVPSAVF